MKVGSWIKAYDLNHCPGFNAYNLWMLRKHEVIKKNGHFPEKGLEESRVLCKLTELEREHSWWLDILSWSQSVLSMNVLLANPPSPHWRIRPTNEILQSADAQAIRCSQPSLGKALD